MLMSACGGHHAAGSGGPTTTLVTSDRWAPPTTDGTASVANFCTLIVADYQHLAELSAAANLKVREQIVSDAVRFAPRVISAAPSNIASPAARYLGSMAQVLGALDAAGLNAANLKSGAAGLLFDPKVQSAGNQVIAYTAQHCHYQIGG